VLFFLVSLYSSLFYAGGWPQPKGGYFLKLSEWWVVSNQHFDGLGEIQPNIQEYGYYSTNLYAEYGLSQKSTLILYFPFINYTYTVIPSTFTRLSVWKTGDTDIGWKYAWTFVHPIALSSTLLIGIPIGYNENNALMTGDGEFNQEVRLDAGIGSKIFRSNGWLNIYSGYNHRTNNYADEFKFGLEGGIRFSKDKVILAVRIDGIKALGNPDNATHINPQSLFSNFREYLSISPEIGFHINKAWGVSLGIGTALSGKNIFASPTFSIGVFHKTIQQNKAE
jgi:hypothetical protein